MLCARIDRWGSTPHLQSKSKLVLPALHSTTNSTHRTRLRHAASPRSGALSCSSGVARCCHAPAREPRSGAQHIHILSYMRSHISTELSGRSPREIRIHTTRQCQIPISAHICGQILIFSHLRGQILIPNTPVGSPLHYADVSCTSTRIR